MGYDQAGPCVDAAVAADARHQVRAMTPSQLAQECRNAFDNRDRDALHRNLARLVALADAVGLQRLSVIELERLRDVKPPSIDPSE